MKPIDYDEVLTFPNPAKDEYKIVWRKRKFFQIKKMPDGRYYIFINKMMNIKTLIVDGFEMMLSCHNCTIKYGKVIKGKRGLLTKRYYCPFCGGDI